MHLSEVPLFLILAGLTAYAVLGGADFGAGFWQLVGGRGARGRAIREHAHHAMGPVWEANHVWLIFVLVICWTSYPRAFGSIMSTLTVPLFVAGIGIVLRGTAYALSSGTATAREQRLVEIAFALPSILTPFALGAAVGGIASGRVPVGNAEGDLLTSWANPTSLLAGTLAVAVAAYLAAVYLAADAARAGRRDLSEAFRVRSLVTGVAGGAVALGGLAVVHGDAHELWDGLTGGAGLAAVATSALAGCATFVFVLRRRFGLARVAAAVAVAAIVAGWVAAQRPELLPGLTVDEAAAGHGTLVWVVASVAGGAVILIPSLALLFGLVLRGRFDVEPAEAPAVPERAAPKGARARQWAAAFLVPAVVLTVFVDLTWARVVGVLALFGFLVAGFVAIAPTAARVTGDQVGDPRDTTWTRRS